MISCPADITRSCSRSSHRSRSLRSSSDKLSREIMAVRVQTNMLKKMGWIRRQQSIVPTSNEWNRTTTEVECLPVVVENHLYTSWIVQLLTRTKSALPKSTSQRLGSIPTVRLLGQSPRQVLLVHRPARLTTISTPSSDFATSATRSVPLRAFGSVSLASAPKPSAS